MQMFREVADIQTADMLKLPVPKVNYRKPIYRIKFVTFVVGIAHVRDTTKFYPVRHP